MIDTFKYETEWEENHMVGVHVRRGDLTIYGKNVSPLLLVLSILCLHLCTCCSRPLYKGVFKHLS